MASNGTPNSVPEVPATQYTPTKNIKAATPDVIVFDSETLPVDVMTEILFEDIGGQEILSLSRNDLINGQTVLYSPIKNLRRVESRYNSNNLFAVPSTSQNYFSSFSIKLEDKVPDVDDLDTIDKRIIYVDKETGDLIVFVTNIVRGENVEIQVLEDGGPVGDILYV
jgi:hypothetical protein